ncbi:MAG TPA: sugar phosphate nucleotidyltransferase [Candidatus Sulfotelmatobacter sp.]|nr:sugar phosphate nucleotidyltransferase [Candidatus Sulfotelmatobacter sp.]
MFVCLAAGRGKRMQPLSNYLHKAMIPFFGVPLLGYSILAVPEGSEIVVVVNYLKEQIAEYFGDFYRGRKLRYFTQVNPRGTGDALFQFGAAFGPAEPIIVWQADQMIFPEEIEILSRTEPNAGIFADTPRGLLDLGFWRIEPGTLARLKDSFDGSEHRALPVLEQEGLKQVRIQREKLEISFDTWEQIEKHCKLFRQRFHTEFR